MSGVSLCTWLSPNWSALLMILNYHKRQKVLNLERGFRNGEACRTQNGRLGQFLQDKKESFVQDNLCDPCSPNNTSVNHQFYLWDFFLPLSIYERPPPLNTFFFNKAPSWSEEMLSCYNTQHSSKVNIY